MVNSNSQFTILHFFISSFLHSSFFILHSSFFILHSSFFILHSSFTIHHSLSSLSRQSLLYHRAPFFIRV